MTGGPPVFRRPMDFGGSWYPADANACRRAIDTHLHQAERYTAQAPSGARIGVARDARIGIAPHAGWIYSGTLEALTYGALAPDDGVELVVVMGGHLRAADPIVAMTEGRWETPFGDFAIHGGFTDVLARHEPVQWERGGRYARDNSTELQLPFAKWKYPRAALLPMRVPPHATAVALGQALADYLQSSGLNAVVVASTDLTHYGANYAFSPKGTGAQALAWVREENDPAFIRAVEGGDPNAVLDVNRRRRNACSAGAVIAATALARERGLRFHALGYGTSADVAGEDSESFVGYLAGVWG